MIIVKNPIIQIYSFLIIEAFVLGFGVLYVVKNFSAYYISESLPPLFFFTIGIINYHIIGQSGEYVFLKTTWFSVKVILLSVVFTMLYEYFLVPCCVQEQSRGLDIVFLLMENLIHFFRGIPSVLFVFIGIATGMQLMKFKK